MKETWLESEPGSVECFEQLSWHGEAGHSYGDAVLPVSRDEVAGPCESSETPPSPISAMTGHLMAELSCPVSSVCTVSLAP